MNRSGEATTIIAVVTFTIMVGSLIAGSYFTTQEYAQEDKKSNFIGDVESKTYYNISCVDSIPESKRIIFETSKQAEELNFSYSLKCL
mgnify:FL=1